MRGLKSHFDYSFYFLHSYKLKPLTKSHEFPLWTLISNFRTDIKFPILIWYYRLYGINARASLWFSKCVEVECVRQQSACSLCSSWLYCSVSVAPAEGERKHLYGMNEGTVGDGCRAHRLCCDCSTVCCLMRQNFCLCGSSQTLGSLKIHQFFSVIGECDSAAVADH